MQLVTALLLWGCLQAVAAAPEVELITEPRPGEEYVLFRASVGAGARGLNFTVPNKHVTEEIPSDTTAYTTLQTEQVAETNAPITETKKPSVEVQTEVSVVISKEMHINGRVIKQEQQRKMENVQIVPDIKHHRHLDESSQHREQAASEVVEFKSEAEIGLVKRPNFETKQGDTITVPAGKFQTNAKFQHTAAISPLTELPPFNILSAGPKKSTEGHDIHSKGSSSHLPLETAGSQNQASRINVKKGANGQEYEYEYIYYYDDDENLDGENDSAEDLTKPVDALPSSTTTSSTTTTTTTTPEPAVTHSGYRNRYLPTETIPEDLPRRGNHVSKDSVEDESKTPSRYTTINRGRGHQRASDVEHHGTEKPYVNEIETPIPVRHSGRQPAPVSEESSEEERLPQITRFPPRGATESSVPSGRVRPSLELVDSSSFRTGAAAPGGVDTSNLGNNVRFLGATEEAYVPPVKARGRSTTTTSTTSTTSTTTAAPEIAATDAPSTDKPHKAAYDLAAFYATLQNADDLVKANEVVEPAHDATNEETTEEVSEDEQTTLPVTSPPTTMPVTSTTTTTTTTTTTEAPTTTTARGRVRGPSRKPSHSTRTRKPPSVSAEVSTAAPVSEFKPKEANKFSPSNVPRTRGRNRGFSATAASSTAAPEEEVVKDSAAPVANVAPAFASKTRTSSIKNAIQRPTFNNSNRRRGPPSRASTTAPDAAPTAEEQPSVDGEPINIELQPSTTASTSTSTNSPKPRLINARPRSPSPLLRRPIRPGLAQSTTAAPAPVEQASEEVAVPEVPAETTSEAAQPSQDESLNATTQSSGLNRLRKRPSLVVTDRPRKAAAAQVPINRGRHLLRRPAGLAAASTPEPKAAPSTESEEDAAAAPATHGEEEHSQEAEVAASSTTASTAAPDTTTESRLSSLIKKRRKPGQHYNVRSSPPTTTTE